MAIEYSLLILPMLDVLTSTTELVSSQHSSDRKNMMRATLLKQLHTATENHSNWLLTKLKRYLTYVEFFNNGNEFNHIDIQDNIEWNMWLYGQATAVLLARLHIALGGQDARKVESQAQTVSRQIFAAGSYSSAHSAIWPVVRLTIQRFSRGVLNTSREWDQIVSMASAGNLIVADVFYGWLKATGIRCPT